MSTMSSMAPDLQALTFTWVNTTLQSQGQGDGVPGQVQAFIVGSTWHYKVKVKVMVYLAKWKPSSGSTWHYKWRSRWWCTWPSASPHLHLGPTQHYKWRSRLCTWQSGFKVLNSGSTGCESNHSSGNNIPCSTPHHPPPPPPPSLFAFIPRTDW